MRTRNEGKTPTIHKFPCGAYNSSYEIFSMYFRETVLTTLVWTDITTRCVPWRMRASSYHYWWRYHRTGSNRRFRAGCAHFHTGDLAGNHGGKVTAGRMLVQ